MLAALPGLLAACASVPRTAPPAVFEPAWTLKGRLGVRTQSDSVSVHIVWKHRAESDEVLVTTPLGQGVAQIGRSQNGAWLDIPNQAIRHAPDIETLTREALGYVLPVTGLKWWVQALPEPGSDFARQVTDEGRLSRLEQRGWVIDYAQFADNRPRRLTLTREDLVLRLVIDSWAIE